MKSMSKDTRFSTRDIAVIGVFTAIASILFWIPGIPIFAAVPFYKLDFSNVPVILVSFALGPIQGLITLGLKDVIGLLHSTSAGVGELADFLVSLAYILPSALIYKCNKTKKSAIIGMIVATLVAVVAGIFVNKYLILPYYFSKGFITEEKLVAMGQKLIPAASNMTLFLICITGLFNLIKFTLVSLITALIYKPLSPLMHGGRVKEH